MSSDRWYIVVRTIMWIFVCILGMYFSLVPGVSNIPPWAGVIFALLGIGFLWQGIYWWWWTL